VTDERQAVLELLLEHHPGLLSIEELTRELIAGADTFDARDRIAVAVRELVAAGLANRVGEFVFASHAAAVADRLAS
jgi:Fe2+ or Zn2+ uptake regulation protein